MRIGIGLPNQVRNVRPDVIPEWAVRAEKAGFSTLGTVGRIAYPGVMDTVALAAAAGATAAIRLLTNILIAPVWPPVLLAKEVAGIDAISGGRLTLGIGTGGRPDDFVVKDVGPRGRGKRLDHDLAVYRAVWRGEPVGGTSPAVPAGSREVPLVFGGFSDPAFERMARWGQGYIGASMPAATVADAFAKARTVWADAGREGSPRLIAIAYYAIGDIDTGRANVRDYYRAHGEELADATASGVNGGPDAVRSAAQEFAAIGTDELIFNPTLDDPGELLRLADVVL